MKNKLNRNTDGQQNTKQSNNKIETKIDLCNAIEVKVGCISGQGKLFFLSFFSPFGCLLVMPAANTATTHSIPIMEVAGGSELCTI